MTEAEITQYLEENRAKLETGPDLPRPPHPDHARGRATDAGLGERPASGPSCCGPSCCEGADFAELAQQHSRDASARDGGDLGTLKRGELRPGDRERRSWRWRRARSPRPVRSALGYHVFRLESKETLEGDGLSGSGSRSARSSSGEKFDARLDAWLKEIKQRAIIEVRM